jgi:hypothetical protein
MLLRTFISWLPMLLIGNVDDARKCTSLILEEYKQNSVECLIETAIRNDEELKRAR